MNNFNISIFGNKIFLEIIRDIKIFSDVKIKYYDDLKLCIKNSKESNSIVIFFINETNKDLLNGVEFSNLPLILITNSINFKHKLLGDLIENLNAPFHIKDFEKKTINLLSKSKFKKNSLINLRGYIIDKNERKIKKNDLELQLSEKEINFLVLFSENKEPISRNSVLKTVWNYSDDTETHTVETHIHRLRKKILEKFNDNNFIKNSNKGYFI
jgi:two-component SAPR family response regulator